MESIIRFLTIFDWSIPTNSDVNWEEWAFNATTFWVGLVISFFNFLNWAVDHSLRDYSLTKEQASLRTKFIHKIALLSPIIGTFIAMQFPLGWGWLVGCLLVIIPLFFIWEGEFAFGYWENVMEYNAKKDNYKVTLQNYSSLYTTYLNT